MLVLVYHGGLPKTINGIYYGTEYLIYGSEEEEELTESEILKKEILKSLNFIKLKWINNNIF